VVSIFGAPAAIKVLRMLGKKVGEMKIPDALYARLIGGHILLTASPDGSLNKPSTRTCRRVGLKLPL
jgi:hypothetical protein